MDEDLTNTGKEGDYLKVDIACLNPKSLHATLVSTVGSHCEVWRTNKRSQADRAGNAYLEFVIKYPLGNHSQPEITMLAKHYRMLRQELDDVIPEAIFSITRVDGNVNVCVVARAVNIWFDIANPQNREEAVELLRTHVKPRVQLERFIRAAKAWRASGHSRLIDLFGVDNLVMDTNREIRYLDSFFVFFFEDMLDLLQEPDEQLEYRINRSVERLEYLEEMLGESKNADP
ncbi:MAG: hypothetical protein OQL16_09925 [Gammaproteobacteria bacterium]|nr:hypothetical protein [Gammaproteobacteria bacterium]